MRGGAFFNGKKGRDDFRKTALQGGYILSFLRKERLGEKGGAFLKGKEGRVGFNKKRLIKKAKNSRFELLF